MIVGHGRAGQIRQPVIGIAAHLDEAARDLLHRELDGDHVVWVGRNESDFVWRDELAACHVVFGTVPADWIASLRALEWLQLESIGFEYYRGVADDLAARKIQVTNLSGLFAAPAAETALAGVLALARGVDQLIAAQAQRQWVSLGVRPTTETLQGKRVLVLGAGSIGLYVRTLFEAFGCSVTSFARTSPRAQVHTAAELDRALLETDILVSALPSTTETRLLLDQRRIALLPRSAVFVNIGRGSVVDEDALIEALTCGLLGGAVLDVTSDEPLAEDSPLWSLPRVVLTQHTGGGSCDELVAKARRFLENLTLWRGGHLLEHRVDVRMGY